MRFTLYLCTRPPQVPDFLSSPFLTLFTLPTPSSSVLVVDDDEAARSFVRKALQRDGYTVWEAADPDEALRFAEQHRDPVHLLLADIALPWMRGTELFQRFALHHPETQVIYMSGYTREAIGPCPTLAAGSGFIQKPFSTRMLMDKVKETLTP